MTSDSLARAVEDFLLEVSTAVVVEDGDVIFDLAQAKYSISGGEHKCLLHMWSQERNVVRRILDAEVKNGLLRLQVQRLGQSRPTKLEICRNRDWRTPTAKKVSRLGYRRLLERVLQRRFPGFAISHVTNSADLKHSFGPIYARGILQRGQSAFVVVGVNAQETQASIDAALTFGILWLDLCRKVHAGKLVIEGLKLFLPQKSSLITRERIAQLSPDAAKWHLYELEERNGELIEVEVSDRGNMATRMVHAPDEASIRRRFAGSISLIRGIMPESEIAILSSAEIAFRRHGLEFARARLAQDAVSFQSPRKSCSVWQAAKRFLRALT